ncbi:protein spaetzle-like [Tachypleus tridentatus]|uniref:protein spaetzle-like n=1 Tax=Tachypleus tridentatus TaxID=6853 RepID=UPI003FD67CCB
MYVQFPAKLETIGDNEPFGYFYNFSGNGSDQRQWNSFPSRMVALCDSKQKLVYPSYAKDSTGKWNLIVQTDEFPQRIPVELCRSQDEPCGNIAACGLSSRCVQKYAYQLLLSIDHEKPEKCPTMKLYKFHSACVCFAQREKENWFSKLKANQWHIDMSSD